MSIAAELGVTDEEALKNIEILKSKGVNMSTLQILEQKLISDWGLHFSLIITAQNNIVSPFSNSKNLIPSNDCLRKSPKSEKFKSPSPNQTS